MLVLALGSTSLANPRIDPKEEAFIGSRRSYWAFQPVKRPVVPEVALPSSQQKGTTRATSFVRTPIDAFILQQLLEKNLTPSAEATRLQLLRRVTLDLTGLPPTPEQAAAFLSDPSPKAYEALVDRLMQTPAYGERWAARWLDIIRYADTNGYEVDGERTHAWRYRDYVVESFRKNKPYDRFLKEQIAGDELFPGDTEALHATGFHRAGPIHIVAGNVDAEMSRQEVLTEMTHGVANVFLGLTVGCARCHNHKFDPILQADYYRLQAIFAGTELKDVPLEPKEKIEAYEAAVKAVKAKMKVVSEQISALEKPTREKLSNQRRAELSPEFAAILERKEEDLKTPEEKMVFKAAKRQITPLWDEVVQALPAELKAQRVALRKQIHALEREMPAPPAAAYAVVNMEKAPQMHILKVGDFRHKLDPVEPALPTVLGAIPGPATPQGRRSLLANWLASPEHPLTARVMVNRIWQFRMGTGIVPTPNDFGALGGKPTNRKLLDWLAAEFVSSGWDIRHLDRMIVTSSVYRQSSQVDPAKAAVDGENKYYWRSHRKRMDSDTLRDAMLQVSGLLNPQMGGRPVRVPIEQEVYDLIFTEGETDNLWPLDPDPTQRNRRTLYLLNKRTVRIPFLTNFDQPDAINSCPVRSTSTHALQALSLLNSDFAVEQASALSARALQTCGERNLACQTRQIYQLVLTREPNQKEKQQALDFLQRQKMPLIDFSRAMLNRNEFVYLP